MGKYGTKLGCRPRALLPAMHDYDWKRKACKVVGLVLLYYPFSIGLTFYQKWFIKSFRFPLTVVCLHYIIKFTAAALIRCCVIKCSGRERVSIGWWVALTTIAPTGIAASLDIGLSNWAFEYITVSLYTMAKSTCIVFILLFAVLLKLEKLTWAQPIVVALISSGLFLFTFRSAQFDFTGFLLVELAALCSGVRWVVSQLLMQRKDLGLENPVDMIYNVQPWMVLSCIPLVLIFEGQGMETALEDAMDHSRGTRIICLILVGGLIALCMELSEYLLLVHTSSLTVSVAGIFKELFTLIAAHFLNGDKFTSLNTAGLALCILGIGGHVWMKARALQTKGAGEEEEDERGTYRLLHVHDHDPLQNSDSEAEDPM